MLPEEQQRIILRKKHYKKVGKANKKERNQLIQKALFHRW